jgi:fluoride exporter
MCSGVTARRARRAGGGLRTSGGHGVIGSTASGDDAHSGGRSTARYGTSFPCAKMVINVSGRVVIGFFLVLISERCIVHPNWRLFFAIGFLRSYTTCSTFSFETFSLIERRSSLMALVNTVGSVRLGQLAVMTGMLLARMP